MSITGYHRIIHTLVSKENPTLVVPLLKDDMKRFLGNLIQESIDVALLVDLDTPVLSDDQTQLWQEVFIAKIRPEECKIGDLIHICGKDDYFLDNGMVFDHKSQMREHVYERIG